MVIFILLYAYTGNSNRLSGRKISTLRINEYIYMRNEKKLQLFRQKNVCNAERSNLKWLKDKNLYYFPIT